MNTEYVFIATVETPAFPFLHLTVIDTTGERAVTALRELWEKNVAARGPHALEVPTWVQLVDGNIVTCNEVKLGAGVYSWDYGKTA
jgi:hypothetical protein